MKQTILLTIISSIMIVSCSKDGNINDKIKSKKQNTSSTINSSQPKLAISNVKQNSSQSLNLENNLANKLKENSSETITSNQEKSSVEDEIKKVDISLIPVKFGLSFKNGDPKHNLAVFVDINQPYTKSFLDNISKISNTTIYLFPINGDTENLEKIYCSDDQQQSLISYLNGLKIENNNRNCDKDGLDYSLKYFKDTFKDKQTPIIVFDDGNYVSNALNANYNLINEYQADK